MNFLTANFRLMRKPREPKTIPATFQGSLAQRGSIRDQNRLNVETNGDGSLSPSQIGVRRLDVF